VYCFWVQNLLSLWERIKVRVNTAFNFIPFTLALSPDGEREIEIDVLKSEIECD